MCSLDYYVVPFPHFFPFFSFFLLFLDLILMKPFSSYFSSISSIFFFFFTFAAVCGYYMLCYKLLAPYLPLSVMRTTGTHPAYAYNCYQAYHNLVV